MPSELDLLQGTLDVLVLRALSWGPMPGYAIARFIHRGSAGAFTILDGALYTALHRLEAAGLAASEWGISDLGKRALVAERRSWEDYVRAVAGVLRARPAPA